MFCTCTVCRKVGVARNKEDVILEKDDIGDFIVGLLGPIGIQPASIQPSNRFPIDSIP